MNFLEEVRRGIRGLNEGVPGGLPSFDKGTFNTQHGKIYGLVGSSKSGKTALLIQRYIVYPYLSGANIKWIWYSLEMSRNAIIARLTSIFADIHSREEWKQDKQNIRYRIPESKILGLGEEKLTEDEFEYVKKINKLFIEPLMGVEDENGNVISEGRIEFIEDLSESNPTGINKHLMEVAKKHGSFRYTPYETKNSEGKTVVRERMVGYQPNDDTKIWVMIDHLGLMKKEQNHTIKENIDKMINEYAKMLRNMCGFTFILVSQLNRGIKGIDRMKFTGEQLQPQTEDIKDSAGLEETADMVIALFNPNTYTHLTYHLGYELKHFDRGYRSVHVIASRYTPSPINKSLFFNAKTGRFIELYRPNTPEYKNQLEAIKNL